MNNYLAMNICEAIMPIKDDSVNVTIVTNSGNVYNNVEVDDFDTKGVYFTNNKYVLYVAYDKLDLMMIMRLGILLKLLKKQEIKEVNLLCLSLVELL